MADITKYRRFVNVTRQQVLAEKAFIADNILTRMRGLLFRPQLASGEGLYLERCNCIHMFGMAYAIDAVFVSRDLLVVGLCDSIKPGQMSKAFGGARGCLELPAGTISNTATKLGDKIEIT